MFSLCPSLIRYYEHLLLFLGYYRKWQASLAKIKFRSEGNFKLSCDNVVESEAHFVLECSLHGLNRDRCPSSNWTSQWYQLLSHEVHCSSLLQGNNLLDTILVYVQSHISLGIPDFLEKTNIRQNSTRLDMQLLYIFFFTMQFVKMMTKTHRAIT